jgi:4'-phosphopantetheinyl transferase
MWSQPSPSLHSDEVHVWRIGLDQPPEFHERFLRTLDREEQARANRFHFEKHRRRFMVARGFLRLLLARYLDTKPEDVRFSYGPYGKPKLQGEHHPDRLRFNVSHSHEIAVFGFAYDHELGIDVEYINHDFAREDIASRFFSRSEVETLNALPDQQKTKAFFRCWTRKEAYIKAIGSGLSHPLDQFDVTLAPGEPAALLRVAKDPQAAARWTFFDLEIEDDYAGALAVEGPIQRLHGFQVESV